MPVDREDWLDHVRNVVRSRHYTWLPEGLGGEPIDSAMAYLVADIMHVCHLQGIPFDDVLAKARARFDSEESEVLASNPQVDQ